jgi:hypothetical protein
MHPSNSTDRDLKMAQDVSQEELNLAIKYSRERLLRAVLFHVTFLFTKSHWEFQKESTRLTPEWEKTYELPIYIVDYFPTMKPIPEIVQE